MELNFLAAGILKNIRHRKTSRPPLKSAQKKRRIKIIIIVIVIIAIISILELRLMRLAVC